MPEPDLIEVRVIGPQGPAGPLGPPGPQGPPGPAGASEAENVSYNETTVAAVLDQLLYVPPRVVGFTNSAGVVEIGRVLSDIALAWTLAGGRPVVAQIIDPGVGAVPPGTLTTTVPGPVAADTTWTLTVGDGQSTATADTSVLFRHRRRWGAVEAAPTDSAGILALGGNAFATGRAGSMSVANPSGRRLCCAWPAAWGDPPQVRMRGFVTTDYTLATIAFTNASGHLANYRVLTTNAALAAGDIPVEIF